MKVMNLVLVFCIQVSSVPSNIAEEAIISPLYVFGTFVKNQVSVAVWIHTGSSILFHSSSYMFLHHDVFIAMTL
jgi:hypothetical protein